LAAEFIRQLDERIQQIKESGDPYTQFVEFVDIAYNCRNDYPDQYEELFKFWLERTGALA
jgi:hypothetical protein